MAKSRAMSIKELESKIAQLQRNLRLQIRSQNCDKSRSTRQDKSRSTRKVVVCIIEGPWKHDDGGSDYTGQLINRLMDLYDQVWSHNVKTIPELRQAIKTLTEKKIEPNTVLLIVLAMHANEYGLVPALDVDDKKSENVLPFSSLGGLLNPIGNSIHVDFACCNGTRVQDRGDMRNSMREKLGITWTSNIVSISGYRNGWGDCGWNFSANVGLDGLQMLIGGWKSGESFQIVAANVWNAITDDDAEVKGLTARYRSEQSGYLGGYCCIDL